MQEQLEQEAEIVHLISLEKKIKNRNLVTIIYNCNYCELKSLKRIL
jgi:hypothetical protein